MTRTLFAASALALLAAAPANAGTLFEMVTTDAGGQVVTSGEIKADGARLAMSGMAGQPDMAGDTRMIFRGDQTPAVMYVINDAEAQYMVMEPQAMGQGMANMQSQVQAAMAQAMANMTPEQRAQMEAVMNAQGGGGMGGMAGMGGMPGMQQSPTTVQATGQTRNVEGVSTRGYEVREGGQLDYMVWAAEPGAVSGGQDLVAGFDALAGFMEAMPQMASVGALYDLDELDGRVPLQIEDYEGGAVVETTTISPGQSMAFPDSEFEPDPSYSQQQMFGGL